MSKHELLRCVARLTNLNKASFISRRQPLSFSSLYNKLSSARKTAGLQDSFGLNRARISSKRNLMYTASAQSEGTPDPSVEHNPLGLNDPSLFREHCLIGGEWVAATSGSLIPVFNPASGEEIAKVPKLSAAETELAVLNSKQAQEAWAKGWTAKERGAVLWRWFHLIQDHKQDLARVMTMEQGKPTAEALGEVDYASSFISWFAEEGRRVYGDTIPMNSPSMRCMVVRQGVGVCAAITPWNFPSAMITRKAGAALAAGCSFLVKPSELTPLSALALGELANRAGIPPGVFNVVTGSGSEVGGVLASSENVNKLSFTGSTATGKLLLSQCAETVKRTSMELGGNAPFIVFSDADLESAVEGAMLCKFRNSGQTCVCANRFLVQDSVYDEFVSRLSERMSKLVLGPGINPGSTQGPLINEAAVQKCENHVADARERGAKVVMGGGRELALVGTFFQPTLLQECTQDMRVFKEETFGPVASVFRFSSEAEAVSMANNTQAGLAAYFYTRDVGRTFRVSESLQYGIVGVNTGVISTEVAPFGGIKQSGIGREGSKYGIEEYLDIKYIAFGDVDK